MPLAKKLRVLATFSLGAVSSVAAVLTVVAQDHVDVTDITCRCRNPWREMSEYSNSD